MLYNLLWWCLMVPQLTSTLQINIFIWFSNCTYGYLPEVPKYSIQKWRLHPSVCYSTIPSNPNLKTSQCPRTYKKLWYVNIKEYNLILRKDEIMQFSVLWMDLDSMMRNEFSLMWDVNKYENNNDQRQQNLRTNLKQKWSYHCG